LGPWKLRWARGVFNRANSVVTVPHGDVLHMKRADWDHLIARANDFYQHRELPTIFHITPATAPADLDFLLADRGYRLERSAEVWSANSADVAIDEFPKLPANLRESLSSEVEDDWLTCAFGEANERRKLKEKFFHRIQSPRLFASIRDGKIAVACGVAVLAANRTWVFSMHTEEAHRRKGLARRILTRLARWSLDQNAGRMHLQVMADNVPALNLYTRSGFGMAYRYHYRVGT